jgi:hypothetical protein
MRSSSRLLLTTGNFSYLITVFYLWMQNKAFLLA